MISKSILPLAAAFVLCLSAAMPAVAQTAAPAPAPADNSGIQVQQTADGHGVVSFPINVPRGSDLVDTIQASFDFGETKGLDKPVVNADKSIIAVTSYPATKTSYVSLFLLNANGGLVAINALNLQVGKFLGAPWAEAAQARLAAKSISGRVITLAAFNYTQGNQAQEYDFKLSVGTDGTLKLVK